MKSNKYCLFKCPDLHGVNIMVLGGYDASIIVEELGEATCNPPLPDIIQPEVRKDGSDVKV